MIPDLGDPAPIFIVGPSRSGTSMLREMLNRHPDTWITRETHYFDDLRQRSERSAAELEKYFLAIAVRAYGAEADIAEIHNEREPLRALAASLGGTSDAYFEAFCRLRAQANERSRWGEKTPRHVFRVDEILAAYPTAKIICLARDPRAVVASYRDWTLRYEPDPGDNSPFAGDRRRARRSYGLLLSAIMCKAALVAGLRAAERHGPERVRVQKFESLLLNPEQTMRELCSWTGLEYHPEMLDVPIVQSSYSSTACLHGVSTEPLERWRGRLSRGEVGVIEGSCRQVMHDLEYARLSGWTAWPWLAWATLGLPVAAVRAGLANRRRMGSPLAYILRRLSLSIGAR